MAGRKKSLEMLLGPLGFTDLESRLYGELMRHAPATGYRLAQRVGKAPANIYQALTALQRKGAVVSDETEPKTYKPVPPAELFAALRQTFEGTAREAEAALQALYQPAEEERLYQLKTLPQALVRARAMIESAQQILLFDLFPEPLALLRDALDGAVRRGVTVAGLVYQAGGEAAFTQITAPNAAFVAKHWPGQQLSLIADARDVMLVLVAPGSDELLQGLWSDSAYLACLHHSGLSAEIRLAALAGAGRDPLQHLSLLASAPPGLKRLVKA